MKSTERDTLELVHPNRQNIVRPQDRTDEQQEIIDEQGLDELPEELNHSHIIYSDFLGVPGETTVFKVAFKPDRAGFAVLPTKWLLNAQDCGWEVSDVNAMSTVYNDSIRRWIGRHLPVLGSLFGEKYITIRIQQSDSDRETDGNAFEKEPITAD